MQRIEIIQRLVLTMVVIIIIVTAQKSSQQTIVGLATKKEEVLLETIMPDEVTAKIVNGLGDTSFLNIPKEQYKIGKRL